jgi:hypothetical protein
MPFEVRGSSISSYEEKYQDALIRRYWQFYRWNTAKYGVTSLNKHMTKRKARYIGKHRSVIKALSRNKSLQSREYLKNYKIKMNL